MEVTKCLCSADIKFAWLLGNGIIIGPAMFTGEAVRNECVENMEFKGEVRLRTKIVYEISINDGSFLQFHHFVVTSCYARSPPRTATMTPRLAPLMRFRLSVAPQSYAGSVPLLSLPCGRSWVARSWGELPSR